jgi:hypothetical protein
MSKSTLILTVTTAWLFFFFAFPAFAQYVDTSWVRTYNGPGNGNDYANAVALDSSGNVYVTGNRGTIKYDADGNLSWIGAWGGSHIAIDNSYNIYVNGGSSNCLTVKYYPNGDTAWVRTYAGGPPHGIATDDSGNVYAAGGFQAGFGTIKYYPNGDTGWVRIFGQTGSSWAGALVVDDYGNIYVTGTLYKYYNYNNYYFCTTIKYYSNGDTAWVRTYRYSGNSNDQGYAIGLDHNGNVYVTGQSSGYNNFTIKYDPNGNQLWVERFSGAINCVCPLAQAVDSSGNVYVTAPSGSYDNYDYATIKYYPNGDSAWLRRYHGPVNGNNMAEAIAADGIGNAYVSGYSPGSGTGIDIATIKYYPDGDTAWVIRYNGPGNSSDGASAIAVDGSGNVYVTGWSVVSGTNYDYATFKYWQNHSPVIVVPDSSVFLCAPDTVRYTVLVTDQETWDTLTLSGPGISTPITGPPPLTANVKIYVSSAGTYDYIYLATDKYGGSNLDTATWTITFNSTPTVVAVDSSLFFCDPDTIRFTVTASDPDVADTITLFGPGMSVPLQGVSPLSADVAISIDSTGNYSFIYTASDLCLASGEDTASWTVTVNSQPAPFPLLLPIHDDSIRMPATLWWETSLDTCPNQDIRYDLHLSQSAGFESTIVYSGISDTFRVIDSLQIYDWYWKVKAHDKWGAERWSNQTWSFYVYLCGDCHVDGVVNSADVSYLINYLFVSGPAPIPWKAGDVNGDSAVNSADVAYIINYLFVGGPPPCG